MPSENQRANRLPFKVYLIPKELYHIMSYIATKTAFWAVLVFYHYLKYLFKNPSKAFPWRASSQQTLYLCGILRFCTRICTKNFLVMRENGGVFSLFQGLICFVNGVILKNTTYIITQYKLQCNIILNFPFLPVRSKPHLLFF